MVARAYRKPDNGYFLRQRLHAGQGNDSDAEDEKTANHHRCWNVFQQDVWGVMLKGKGAGDGSRCMRNFHDYPFGCPVFRG